MSSFERIFYTLLSLSFATSAIAEPHSWADNVCNLSIPVKEDILVEEPVQYAIKVQSMCGLLPCTKIRYENRTDQSIKTVVKQVTKLTCCLGYAETQNRRCSPICAEPCGPAGKCIAPNLCMCQTTPTESKPGFTGHTCRRFTCGVENRWGTSCERECQSKCSTNMYCSADTGKCVCEPGWYGADCSKECSPDGEILNSECNFMSQTPPIMEPEANLIVDNSAISSRTRKAEALILANEDDDIDVKIVPKNMFDSQAWTTSSILICVLSLMSLILLVAFLIVKKRYEFVRNELYYASVASVSGSGSSGGSPGSDYSTSTYYTANQSPLAMPGQDGPGKSLENNLNFAAATRIILSGGGLSSQIAAGKKIHLFSPKTESHLIVSQKSSDQNIYTEFLETSKKTPSNIANRSRAETPPMVESSKSDDEDHIYQVPKRSPTGNTSINSSIGRLPTDVSILKESDVSIDLGDDNESNIYEELKPRNKGDL